jgi:hypothetical protein
VIQFINEYLYIKVKSNMKNKVWETAGVALIGAALMPFTVKAQDKVEASVGADLVSSYIWRGQKLGGVSIQPAVSVAYKGWSLGAWGSVGLESEDTREFDLTLGYATGGFSISLCDYWFSNTADGLEAKYFHFGSHDALSSHILEAQVGYDFGVLALNWYTNISGADGVNKDGDRAYSTYISATAPFKLGGLDWTAEVGATPWATTSYQSNGFAVTNVTLGASKSVALSSTFSLPVSVSATWNPRTEGAYFTAGISF